MTDIQQGDVSLFQTSDDGEINIASGITEMGGGLETAAYLSLFGGNEADDGSQDSTFTWWGNLDETDTMSQYRSETQFLLKSIPATTGNLLRIKDAVTRDLGWMTSISVASSIGVAVTMPGLNKVDIRVDIEALGETSSFNFTENWAAKS